MVWPPWNQRKFLQRFAGKNPGTCTAAFRNQIFAGLMDHMILIQASFFVRNELVRSVTSHKVKPSYISSTVDSNTNTLPNAPSKIFEDVPPFFWDCHSLILGPFVCRWIKLWFVDYLHVWRITTNAMQKNTRSSVFFTALTISCSRSGARGDRVLKHQTSVMVIFIKICELEEI